MGSLKLYVWEGVLADYTSGIAFALASTTKEARKLVLAAHAAKGLGTEDLAKEIQANPRIFTRPAAITLHGGG